MKTTIQWDIASVREMGFDEFHSLRKKQYKKYYNKTSKAEIEKEYEYLTGKKT